MTDRELFKDIKKYMDKEITLEGWIKNHRKQKEFGFISFSDGTFFTPVQIVYDNKMKDFDEIQKLHIEMDTFEPIFFLEKMPSTALLL